MKVVDAGVVVALLADGLDPARLGVDELGAPHLVDSEVTHALRRLAFRGALTDAQATAAMAGFLDLAIARFAVDALRLRVWELRHNLSGYDATYVALAEAEEAVLLTTDHRLAAAPGLRCHVETL